MTFNLSDEQSKLSTLSPKTKTFFLPQEKIQVKSVVIDWSELGTHLDGKTFNSIDQVDNFLFAEACMIDIDEIGYNKTSFTITFEDDSTYTGRLDIKNPQNKNSDHSIRKHILDSIRWYTGKKENPHCGMEDYKKGLSERKEIVESYTELEAKYEI